jgi:hypothetical protein
MFVYSKKDKSREYLMRNGLDIICAIIALYKGIHTHTCMYTHVHM